MGYHIVNIKNGNLHHEFVDSYEELAYVEFITDDSIIYQGEEHWSPFKVSESKYKHFSKGWFRAGIQAQELFKEQATENGFILEELNQDQKSFKSYTRNVKSVSIKRGDFLIRNFANIEIDIKCRGFRELSGTKYFDFKIEDAKKHYNMQQYTKTPILIAVYENLNNRPVEDEIYMFSIEDILSDKHIKTHNRKNIGECFKIPISKTKIGFELIEEVYEKHVSLLDKSDSLSSGKVQAKSAFNKWTNEDDELLKTLYCKGAKISDLANVFERTNSAIRYRIIKLGLEENDR